MKRRMIRWGWIALIAALLPGHALAQTTPRAATAQRVALYGGPGETYATLGQLNPGLDVDLLERNPSATWLRVRAATEPPGEGWVLTGGLALDESLSLVDLPVSDQPGADLDAIPDADLAWLYAVPVLPEEVSAATRAIFAQGQRLGNDPRAISKVGDSNSASRYYLSPLSAGAYDLGPYSFLQDTVDYFAESFDNPSVAVRVGLNAFSVFDPIWDNPALCEENEPPLVCEYRTARPAVAVIMFGQNDARVLNSTQYAQQMRRIIETSIDYGVIPVMVTFSADPRMGETLFYQSLRFNRIMVEAAQEYGVPVLNFWAAARALPGYGIGADQVHLSSSGSRVTFTGYQSEYGLSLHNLLVLQTLDLLRRELPMP